MLQGKPIRHWGGTMESSILQGQWWAQREGSRYREWLPLVCSSKIARCVVVVEVLTLAVLQRGADSVVAFPLVLSGG